MPNTNSLFETERLLIRQFVADDLNDFAALCNDRNVMRFMGDGTLLPRAEVARWIDICQVKYAQRGYGTSAVIEKESGQFIGYCGVVRAPENDFDELIYAYHVSAWSKGYATEAGRAMLAYVFERSERSRIYTTIDADHKLSIQVAKKLGMTFEKQVVEADGQRVDHYVIANPTAFPRSTPEAQGISAAAISTFIDAARQQNLELHSLMLLRHGHVVAEGWWKPYSDDRVHLLYSLSKSFTATAIGLVVAEGRLSVDDSVFSFFPDKAPAQVSEHLAAMRVHHLLSMATGHVEDTLGRAIEQGDGDWVKGFLATPPDQAPGTIFCYNNGATFMLSAILQKITGMKLIDYLRPRLLEPLGILQGYWQENPQGINLGFSGFHVTTHAITRLGQLYLQKGEWAGEQLLPVEWVEAAATSHIPSAAPGGEDNPDWAQGYGYQFWRCRHSSYRGDGAFGQFCVIMPEPDAVLAITSGVGDMQAVLDLAWAHLLPAMSSTALPNDDAAHQTLSEQLANLTISPVTGEAAVEATTEMAHSVSERTYRMEATEQLAWTSDHPAVVNPGVQALTFTFQAEQFEVTLNSAGAEHLITGGYGEWLAGTSSFFRPDTTPVLVSGGWTASDTFTLAIRYIETPHCLTLTSHFSPDGLRLEMAWNVMFGETTLPSVVMR